MNYLIINGQKSLFIQGLMIQSLPPISKPMIRSQIDEIDGRDGDTVTFLGFKAYDRTVEIALTRNYDIDEVIKFFNSYGDIIFSNEPYKIYRFDMMQQIDFERLIRFRTAKVTFHVQPFKHSAVHFPLEFTSHLDDIEIINEGNVYARPTFTIYGVGTIGLAINGTNALSIKLGSDEYITIDCENLEAFKGDVLKNRLVTGNYDNVTFNIGKNSVVFTGNVSKVIISNYARWI